MLEDAEDWDHSRIKRRTVMTIQSGVLRKKGSKYYIFDANSGRELLLKGYGSQRIKLEIDPRIDLTKPIFEQAAKLRRSRKTGAVKSLTAAD
jgi:hypothetical protein